jgi:hypothetical protein
MVQLGTTCLRRLARGKDALERRFGRLLRNPNVTVERIVAGWGEGTASAAVGRHVLGIQDGSEVNFPTSEDHRRGLGTIGKGVGRGILLHPMLAVDAASGECLGLVGGHLWTRPEAPPRPRGKNGKKKKDNKARPLSEKESRYWVETAQAAKEVLSSAAMVTMVADRESDIYQMWALVPGPNVHVLGRVYHDRTLQGGGTLLTAARSWPVLATRSILLREREGRPERRADVELRVGSVTLPRPRTAREPGLPDQVVLTLIQLTERNPPEGAEPLVWRLLTTHAANDAEAAWQIVEWYKARWAIEQFFRTLKKQGFQIEDSQVETATSLLKLVAIAARAAVVVMQLTHARDGNSALNASFVFRSEELEVLNVLNSDYNKPTLSRRNPHPHRSLPWAAWIVARLGGWNGYQSDRPPGPITFKNGLDILRTMAAGWALRDMYTP